MPAPRLTRRPSRSSFESSSAKTVFRLRRFGLLAEYEKDVRSVRFAFKQAVFNPTHDPGAPIDTYIQSIVDASESLVAINHKVEATDIIDSIIMHFHSSWGVMYSLFLVRESEPTPTFPKFDLNLELSRSHPRYGNSISAETPAKSA
jgi:hypothetical protein